MGIPVLGSDDDLPALYDAGYQYAFVTVEALANRLFGLNF